MELSFPYWFTLYELRNQHQQGIRYSVRNRQLIKRMRAHRSTHVCTLSCESVEGMRLDLCLTHRRSFTSFLTIIRIFDIILIF